MNITLQCWPELQSSAIAPDIAQLNFRDVFNEEEVYSFLCQNLPNKERTNTGRLRDRWLFRYATPAKHGGWIAEGVGDFGCFKPKVPHVDKEGKRVKYEHPAQMPTRIFQQRITWRVGFKIAERYGVDNDYAQRFWAEVGKAVKARTPQAEGGSEPHPHGSGARGSEGDHQRSHRDFDENPAAARNHARDQTLESEDARFWNWLLSRPEIPVIITEGAKKSAALLSAGFAAIAVPGVWNTVTTPKDSQGNKTGLPVIHEDIAPFINPQRRIYVAFDQDIKPKTAKAVAVAITRFARLAALQKCDVLNVRWRPDMGKGADDVIARNGVQAMEEAIASAMSFRQHEAEQHSALRRSPDLLLNQRYLGDLPIPSHAHIVGIVSPKGTGKTESLSGYVSPFLSEGQKVLVLSHRVQLGHALCGRFGIDYVTDLKNSETGGVFGYGLCVDSLHAQSQARFNPDDWRGAIVLIDECEQVLWHLLNASTAVKEHRTEILKNLEALLVNAVGYGGQVILSDADLSDLSVDYVRDILRSQLQGAIEGTEFEPKTWIAKNDYQGEGTNYDCHWYSGNNPAQLLEALDHSLAKGNRCLLLCSGQQERSQFGTINLEKHFNEVIDAPGSEYPPARILRIDSESIADPDHPAYGCIDVLNETMLDYDLVIASPTIETGVSIDVVGHFDEVYCIASGVQTTDSVRQFLARLREPVPRHLWAAQRGLNAIGNGSSSIKNLLAAQKKAMEGMQSSFEWVGELDVCQVNLLTWAKFASRINHGMFDYRGLILQGLRDEGQRLIEVHENAEIGKPIKGALKAVRDRSYMEKREAIAAAADVTDAQFAKLDAKKSKTPDERNQHRKGKIQRKYGGRITVDPALVERDDSGWHGQIALHYLLTVGRCFTEMRDRKVTEKAHAEGQRVWLPDYTNKVKSLQVAALERLGVGRLLEGDRQFDKDDGDLLDIAKKCKANAWQVKAILGVWIGEKMTPIQVAQTLLRKLGLKLRYLGRVGPRGQRQRIYGGVVSIHPFVSTPPNSSYIDEYGDGRAEVWEAWMERDRAALEALEAA